MIRSLLHQFACCSKIVQQVTVLSPTMPRIILVSLHLFILLCNATFQNGHGLHGCGLFRSAMPRYMWACTTLLMYSEERFLDFCWASPWRCFSIENLDSLTSINNQLLLLDGYTYSLIPGVFEWDVCDVGNCVGFCPETPTGEPGGKRGSKSKASLGSC